MSIAHLGSTKFNIASLKETYQQLAKHTKVHMDTSLNPSSEVCLLALSIFGAHRIMYGSDEPLNLLRSVPYLHSEKGQRIATSYHYHWVDSEDYYKYRYLAQDSIQSHWRALGALRAAINSLPRRHRDDAKRKIFHDNAEEFYNF